MLFASRYRCDLGDPECGGGGPSRRHTAALLLPSRVQHPATPPVGWRLQPLCLAWEEQVLQQQQPSQRRWLPQRDAARSEWTFTQLCGSSSKQPTKQSINSLLQPGETYLRARGVYSSAFLWRLFFSYIFPETLMTVACLLSLMKLLTLCCCDIFQWLKSKKKLTSRQDYSQ